MTRETKIGLLVGLAFIIVIGILLSDHLTSTTEPPQAPLALVGPKMREGITTIGQPTVPVTIEAPPAVSSRTPVITVEEMTRPATVNAVVQLAPPGSGGEQGTSGHVGPSQPSLPRVPAFPQQTVTVVTNDPMRQLVNANAGELQVVGQPGAEAQPNFNPPPDVPAGPPAPSFKEYKAQDGDSLSRIAARLMGSGSKANVAAIVRANPSLKGDPNRIIVGRTYLIPTNATAAGTPALPGQVAFVNDVPPDASAAAESKPSEAGTYWYTVKENDNLWKIAAAQLGTGNAWTAIKELNKDVLKGGETVRKDMRLRLPAKPQTASVRE